MTHAQDRHAHAWAMLALTLFLGGVLGWSARVVWQQARPVVGQCVETIGVER